VVQERVSLLDVPATIFDVAVGDRSYEFGHSRSLGPRLRGEAPPGGAVLSEETSFGWELKALVQPDGLKYIMTHHENETDCLFDLQADPQEQHNLASERSDDVARLKAELMRVVEGARRESGAPGAMSPANPSEMQGLGYVGGPGKDKKPRKKN
jgi:arylsulfatase A-like enzyme